MGIATSQSQEKRVKESIEKGAKGEPEAVEFAVYDRADSSPVGTAGLFQISHSHGGSGRVSATSDLWSTWVPGRALMSRSIGAR
jgi:hypothetical protein